MRAIVTANPNMLIPHYLMACFLYYKEDSPAISDKLFDEMTKSLIEKWDTVTHPHKHLITMEDLMAGTGFAIQYTNMIMDAARHLKEKFR